MASKFSIINQLKYIAIGFVATIVLGYVSSLFLPWWVAVLIAGIIGVLLPYSNGFYAFIVGFLGLLLLWFSVATYHNSANEGLLSSKMGQLFGGFEGNTLLLMVAVLGGVLGGMGAMTGFLGRRIVFPKAKKS